MRIVYFGNADFGTPTLDALLHSPDHSLLTIITNPDKKSGRGKLMTPTPIKRWAVNHNIDILEVKELNNYDFINKLKELKADIFIVIAYRILPLEIFNIPKLGTMNLHASILPLYRPSLFSFLIAVSI